MGIYMVISWDLMGLKRIYPLVMPNIAVERSNLFFFMGKKKHDKLSSSIAMFSFQRVDIVTIVIIDYSL